MAEWLKATDCKSVLSRVRRFETYSAHKINFLTGQYAGLLIISSFKIIVTQLANYGIS